MAHFLSVHRPQRGELLPALDWETPPASAEWALTFLRTLEAEIEARPIFYTYPDFLRRTGSFGRLGRFPLWYASYGPNDGEQHPARPPAQFRTFAVHQFTSRGRVPGIPGTPGNPHADLNDLKLASLEPIVYGPGGGEPWRGELEMYAGGELVSVGNIRTPELTLTEEAREWVGAARAAGGRGRVAPRREEPLGQDEPGGFEPPSNEEGEGFAGKWAEDGDLDTLQQEDFELDADEASPD